MLSLGMQRAANNSTGCCALSPLGLTSLFTAYAELSSLCCGLFLCCPAGLKSKAARLVGAKCTLLARIDAYGQDPEGQVRVFVGGRVDTRVLLLLSVAGL
jgi:hypothetical protein